MGISETCPKCKGLGWIYHTKENGNQYVTKCECQIVEEARQRIERSGISDEFRKKSFENFVDTGSDRIKAAKTTAVKYCKDFPEIRGNRNNSIMFMGQVGSGKTHLSMAICNTLMDRYSAGVVYMPYREDIITIKQNAADSENYTKTVNRFKNAPVLMIDDMLKGSVTGADLNAIFEIINYRYIKYLPLIISTEKTKKELLEFDEGTMSRVLEMSKGYQIEIVGREHNYRI